MLAFNNIAIPIVYRSGANPQTVVLLRYLVFVAVVLVGLILIRRRLWLGVRPTAHALGSGVAMAVGSLGLLGSFAFIPVSLAVVIMYAYPLITALLQSAALRTWPTALQTLCLLAALAGIGLAIGIDELRVDSRGILLALMSACGFGLSFAWNGIALRNADAPVVTLIMSVAGIVVSAAVVWQLGEVRPPGPEAFGWIAFAIATTAFSLAFLGMYKGVALIGGAPAAMIMNLEPIFTIAFAVLLLSEALTWPRLAGAALVIGAVILHSASARRPVPAPAEA